MDAPRIKICCIASPEEAWMAIHAGASAIGLVSRMPSGPGVIPEEHIREIALAVPPPIATFLLTSSQSAKEIIDQQCRCATSTVQIVDRLVDGSYQQLRAGMPGISIVQVVHVVGEESVEEAFQLAPHVDALLLDSGNPNAAIKELGGTGRPHDWDLSRRICEGSGVPVFLAGGLRAENVVEAIRQVRPFGVDVCSGVRSAGCLDPDRLQQFARAVFEASGP